MRDLAMWGALLWGGVELGLMALLLLRLRRVVLETRRRRRAGEDFQDALGGALTGVVKARRLAAMIAFEVTAVAYGLGGWFRRAPAAGYAHRPAWNAVFAGLSIVVLAETVPVHFLVARWSTLAAWLMTIGSIYALLWLAGDAHALRLSPIRVTVDALCADVGLAWRIRIPLPTISDVTRISAAPRAARDLLLAHRLWPDLLLTLREPVSIRGPYGIVRSVSRVTLSCDRAGELLGELAVLRAPDRGL